MNEITNEDKDRWYTSKDEMSDCGMPKLSFQGDINCFDACFGVEEIDIRNVAKEKNVKPLSNENEWADLNRAVNFDIDGSQINNTTESKPSLLEGRVIDHGNDLLNDAGKCLNAIERVFYNQSVVDYKTNKYDILKGIENSIPLCVYWCDDVLVANGAKTKISCEEVCLACENLSKFTSLKNAQKIVVKLIVKNLKKVF